MRPVHVALVIHVLFCLKEWPLDVAFSVQTNPVPFLFRKLTDMNAVWLSDVEFQSKWAQFTSQQIHNSRHKYKTRELVDKIESLLLYTVEVEKADLGVHRDTALVVLVEFVSQILHDALKMDQGNMPYYIFGRTPTRCSYKFVDLHSWSWIEYTAQYAFSELARLDFADYVTVSQSLVRIYRVEEVRSREVAQRGPQFCGDSDAMFCRLVEFKNNIRTQITGNSEILSFIKVALRFNKSCLEFGIKKRRATTRLEREIFYAEFFKNLFDNLSLLDVFALRRPTTDDFTRYKCTEIQQWTPAMYVYQMYFSILVKQFSEDASILTMTCEKCPDIDHIRMQRNVESNWMDNSSPPDVIEFEKAVVNRMEDVYFEIVRKIVEGKH